MNFNYKDTNENMQEALSVAEVDDFMSNIDYDEMTRGIKLSRDDFKHGRFSDIRTSMERTRRMLFGE